MTVADGVTPVGTEPGLRPADEPSPGFIDTGWKAGAARREIFSSGGTGVPAGVALSRFVPVRAERRNHRRSTGEHPYYRHGDGWVPLGAACLLPLTDIPAEYQRQNPGTSGESAHPPDLLWT